MLKKYVVVAPSFNENVGGNIVLHKLCDVMRKQGVEAYICPVAEDYLIRFNYFFKDFFKSIEKKIRFHRRYKKFSTNPRFSTPILNITDFEKNKKDFVVIYPETVCGNPLGALNVVRWLLHQPGFHTGFVGYGSHELIVKFNDAIRDFSIPGSKISDNFLKVIDYPIDLYNQQGCISERQGVAYCVRKGKGKNLKFHPDGAILIDHLSHIEVAKIFKSVKTFISYDDYTAYSVFAVLCGCESIVIPADGVSEQEWYPDVSNRYGIAYGFDQIEWANSTSHLQIDRTFKEIEKVNKSVESFIFECENYFCIQNEDI